MRFGLFGDIHARIRAPQGRKDDWFAVQDRKLRQALEWMKSKRCDYVLQPGDLFDTPKPSNFLLQYMIRLIEQYDMTWFGVLGQHDTYYHDVSRPDRTATGVLQASGKLMLLGDKPIPLGDVWLYGAPWGQEPPSLRRKAPGESTRILVSHAQVGDRALWPGHKLPSPTHYAQQHPGYDFILLGDYHYWFQTQVSQTTVVNVGALMRMRNTPLDRRHEPVVGLLDTGSMEVEFHQLDIVPPEQVFRPTTVVEASHPPEALQEFLDRLKDSGQLGVSFVDNLEIVVLEQKARRGVRLALAEILETVGVKGCDE